MKESLAQLEKNEESKSEDNNEVSSKEKVDKFNEE